MWVSTIRRESTREERAKIFSPTKKSRHEPVTVYRLPIRLPAKVSADLAGSLIGSL